MGAFGGGLPAEGVAAGGFPLLDGGAVELGGAGNNVGARAINGGVITLDTGTTVNFAAGGGQNTGLWASGAGSQIITNGATVSIPATGGAGGNDTGVLADTGAAITLNGGAVTVHGNGGGETGLLATGAGSSITGTGVVVDVTSLGGTARGGVRTDELFDDVTGLLGRLHAHLVELHDGVLGQALGGEAEQLVALVPPAKQELPLVLE